MRIIFLIFLLIFMNNAIKINNCIKKEYAAILNFAPMLRVHDIIVFHDNSGISPDWLLDTILIKCVPTSIVIHELV